MNSDASLVNLYIILIVAALVIVTIPLIFKKGRRIPGEHVQQRETDLRLTYKRFMELYPYSKITYQEYKQMQAKHAYKKAVSSLKIKRMVR